MQQMHMICGEHNQSLFLTSTNMLPSSILVVYPHHNFLARLLSPPRTICATAEVGCGIPSA
eukprot:COSAG01_NODE_5631_length_4130_cov_193.096750_2_plen_61_part_00